MVPGRGPDRRGLWPAVVAGLVALLASPASGSTPLPLGADPETASRYAAAVTLHHFTCFDGSRVIPHDHVNDDFCDCADGSDEPGTSACPNGTFYCKNKGHESKLIHSGFVDDDVCDCCDGSDEAKGKCANECLASAHAAIKDLEEMLVHMEEGMKRRQEYVSKAGSIKSSWVDRIDELSPEIEQQSLVVNNLKAKKEEIEAEEEKVREAERAEREKDEDTRLAYEDLSAGEDEAYPGDEARDWDPEYETGEGFEEEEGELDPDEVGRRIAARWTSDPEATAGGEAGGKEEPFRDGDEGEPYYGDYRGASYDYDDEGDHSPGDLYEEGSYDYEGEAGAFDDYRGDYSHSEEDYYGDRDMSERPVKEESEGDKIRKQFTEEDAKLKKLTTEQTTLTAKLGQDMGPDGVFTSLDGRCFDTKVDKYTYEICMGGQAKQKEGHSSVALGTWSGGLESGKLMYENGQACWQGPKRSLTVTLQCGSTETLHTVEEPSRCDYTAKLMTPAACVPGDLESSKQKLEELRGLVSGVHDEL